MQFLEDKVVLVTGGGGSIGTELVKAIIASGKPKTLIIVDISEYGLYRVQEQVRKLLKEKGVSVPTKYLIADIRHEAVMDSIFKEEAPDYVYHAAALKHVPMLEEPHNTLEAIRTNVLGTRLLLRVSEKYRVKQFLLISTDKAVEPISMMGATKALAEQCAMGHSGSPQVVVVRFGNVLGSSGSVVPLFHKQIEEGGPVTVTHKNVVRYFMTIYQAVRLVLSSSRRAKEPASLFVLDMGKPMRIDDLARNMIYASGKDIAIKYIGLRPGEKMYESLTYPTEILSSVEDEEGVFMVSGFTPIEGLEVNLKALQEYCEGRDFDSAIALLRSLIPYPENIIESPSL